jgi:predicted glycosyltransferase
MIYVQHLLGIGHLRRAALLARGLDEAGYEVLLVSGGMPVRGLSFGGARFHQLPPVRAADPSFSALVGAEGQPVEEALRTARRGQLLARFRAFRPDALILETYPFGRRMMRFELEPLLSAAGHHPNRPLVLASIRDVLQARAPKRIAETVHLVEETFDGVLVHGDPALIPFDESFPAADRIAAKVFYTGYLADLDRRPARANVRRNEVVVSAGGGAVGRRLLETAIAARPLSVLKDARWRLLVGDNRDASLFDDLRRESADGVVIERARQDFQRLLAGALLSLSQAGYNTVMDILLAATPSVLVPFAGDGETEQPLRARVLADRGWATVVDEDRLSAVNLAAAVDRAVEITPPAPETIDLAGMKNSARILARLFEARR